MANHHFRWHEYRAIHAGSSCYGNIHAKPRGQRCDNGDVLHPCPCAAVARVQHAQLARAVHCKSRDAKRLGLACSRRLPADPGSSLFAAGPCQCSEADQPLWRRVADCTWVQPFTHSHTAGSGLVAPACGFIDPAGAIAPGGQAVGRQYEIKVEVWLRRRCGQPIKLERPVECHQSSCFPFIWP